MTTSAKTLTQLNDKLCRNIVHASESELDVISTVDVQQHNTMSFASSMEWDFDLKDLWLTPQRWSMMVNQYVDVERLRTWLEIASEKVGTRGRGIAMMRTKEVLARGGPAQGNKETRRWGACMLGVSYKAKPAPQITLYSRTSYLGYLGALDLSVAWMCGRYLATLMGIDVAEIQFLWMNEALQYHNFKSLAYLLNHPDEDERKLYRKLLMKEHLKPKHEAMMTPALTLSRKWLQKLMQEDRDGVTLGDMSYNTYRRIRRRFHTEVLGYEHAQRFEGWSYYKTGEKAGEEKEFFKAYQPLPSTPVQKLNFDRLGISLGGLEVVEWKGDDDMEDDDE